MCLSSSCGTAKHILNPANDLCSPATPEGAQQRETVDFGKCFTSMLLSPRPDLTTEGVFHSHTLHAYMETNIFFPPCIFTSCAVFVVQWGSVHIRDCVSARGYECESSGMMPEVREWALLLNKVL